MAMLTRRTWINCGLLAPAGAIRLMAFAAEPFWNARPAAEWQEKEIAQILNRSPWAKQAEAQFGTPDGDGPGGMGGPPGGGTGGPPGGGMGGPPGGGMGGPPGGMPPIRVTVRWESAGPVAAARKKQPEDAAAEYYIVGVGGLPIPGSAPPGEASEDAPAEGDRPRRTAPTAQQRKAMIGSIARSTVLQRKGKDPLLARRVGEMEEDGTPTLLFYFPRADNPITLSDKEVTFVAQLGPMQLKAKFALKDMQYHGQLAL
jgi:hypothetical protein